VLLSVRIFCKLLVYHLKNWITVVCIKFVQVYFLFDGLEYVVFLETVRKFPFLPFLIVFSIFPYACPVSNTCREYPVSGH
jgi:hypothetical protein